MTQRYTLDRSSFEQFLAAASLLQQFQRRAFEDRAAAQPLWKLVDLQRGIDAGTLDLASVIQHVPRLAWELVGGTGAGVWLFNTDDEFVWRAGTRSSQDDEHLRFEILSRLAAFDEGSDAWRNARHNWDAGYYPGCAKSLLVQPIRLDEDVAGAVAVFATEFDAFTDRDASKVRLLATLLGYALQRGVQLGKFEAAALLPGEVREVLKRQIPRLKDFPEYEEEERSADPVTDYEPENPLPVEPGTRAQEPLFAYSTAEQPFEDLSPSQQRQEAESQEPVYNSESSSVADIYVPGIGVRAALGSDDEEVKPSRVWTGLRSGFGLGMGGIVALFTFLFGGIRSAAVFVANSIVSIIKGTGRGVANAASYRPKLPALPTAAVRSQLGRIQTLCRTSLRAAGSGLRSASRRLPRRVHPPTLPAEPVENRWHWAGAWTGKSLDALGRSLRRTPKLLPALPTHTIDKFVHNLNTATGAVCRRVVRSSRSFGNEIAQLRFPQAWQWNMNPRHVRRVAPAMVVLAVMLAFLFAQAGFRRNVQVAAASTSVSVPPAAAVLSAPKLTSTSIPTSPLANSPTHHQITDPETKDDIENMTRYEIATVRRAALYGDDIAAFQLGMAYETGYAMTQNCKKAAEWVTRAANAGNPAAQYNLGLRYRDGDGVTPNATEAEKWLKKAAEHKYGNAASRVASAGSAGQ